MKEDKNIEINLEDFCHEHNGVKTWFYRKLHWPGERATGWNVPHDIHFGPMDGPTFRFYTRECVNEKCDFSDCKYCFRLWQMSHNIKGG